MMNDQEIKIVFYKNKIDHILEKIKRLKEKIGINKDKILEFIRTIVDNGLKEILLNKINSYYDIETQYKSNLDSIEHYHLIKNEYKTLKYTKNILKENWFLYWDDTLNYEEKIHFILLV